MNRLVFDPIIPAPWIALIGLAFAAATVLVYFHVGSRLPRWRNALLALSRLIAVGAVLFALLQPSRREDLPSSRARNVILVGIDASRSMRQTDGAKNTARLDLARDLARDAGLLAPGDTTAVKFFEFGDNAAEITAAALDQLKADSATTNFHRSVQTMLDSAAGAETVKGLVLLTDGHDQELTSAAKTAFAARSRFTPIYAVALGAQGNVRDASMHITNYQPYCFVHQTSHITASIRLIGCEHEDLSVQLLRQHQVVKTTTLNAGEQAELPVDFEVTEADPGQYEYEVRVVPLAHEADVKNNGALTYLNVIDQQISVLLLEGAPYWDTTFLSRSLFGNDKVALDAVFQYKADKSSRRIRKLPGAEDWKLPRTRQEFERYDAVILGREVSEILDKDQIAALGAYVREHGGTVIFGRGKAYEPADDLDPVKWGDTADADVSLQAARQSNSMPALRTLTENLPGGLESMPHLIGSRRVAERKTLAAVVAEVRNAGGAETFPGIIHRQYGRGQVLSVAVDGLWRWSFNPKATATNNLFDRFWDQLLVWLVSGSDITPSRRYSFRANTANLLLGEKISLRLASHDTSKPMGEMPVTIYRDDKMIALASLSPQPGESGVLHTDYLPEKTGRYRAVSTLPDGAAQEMQWMVYEDNPEEKDVAVDVPYLKALCEASGGQLLAPAELKPTVERLNQPAANLQPKTRLTSVWDRAWVFYAVCAALALDWYLRRKWGLC